jgi:NAD(P)-dependent dehydrogenase (short-subunit alcohol dehydrogenase family)
MQVALLDIDGDRAESEAATLADATNATVTGGHLDVSGSESVMAAAQAVHDTFGRLDLVVSNVGVQLFGSVDQLTDDEWRWVLDVNVIGAARTARAFLPMLRSAPRPRLAFTTSSSVLDPASRMAAYQASKFALWGLAETLRLELSDDGVAVSVIFPSGMISRHLETSEAVQPEAIRRSIGSDEDFAAMIASNPTMAEAVISPDDAAANIVDAVLAGERYIVTHGQLEAAVSSRSEQLRAAAATRH